MKTIHQFEGEDLEPSFCGPYDPKDIDVNIEVVNLGYLLEMLENNEIELSPEFQRSSDVWSPTKKSRLIESVLLGLPLPSFYFSEEKIINENGMEEKKLVIVDGLQRLCAFKDFCIAKKLCLTGLQFLPNLEGKTIDDLDRVQTRRLKGLKVTLNTLRNGTPMSVKFVIFQRVNSAGEPLTPQEMRNALYQGKSTKLLKDMVSLESFKLATGRKIKEKRMVDRDFANRFVAFYLFKSQYDSGLDVFMSRSLEAINRMDQGEVESILKAFDNSMNRCYMLLGGYAFRRPNPNKEGKYLKINKALFEVLSVSMAMIDIAEESILKNRKEVFVNGLHELYSDTDFIRSITSGTAKSPQVKFRFEKVSNLIKSVLNYD